MSFEVPESVREIRARVIEFVEKRCYPVEPLVEDRDDAQGREAMRELMNAAKAEGLWNLTATW